MAGEYKKIPLIGDIPVLNVLNVPYNMVTTAWEAITDVGSGIGNTLGNAWEWAKTGALVGAVVGVAKVALGYGSGDIVKDVVETTLTSSALAAGTGALVGGVQTIAQTGSNLANNVGAMSQGILPPDVPNNTPPKPIARA